CATPKSLSPASVYISGSLGTSITSLHLELSPNGRRICCGAVGDANSTVKCYTYSTDDESFSLTSYHPDFDKHGFPGNVIIDLEVLDDRALAFVGDYYYF